MFIGFGVGEPIVYWFLRIFLLIVLTYCGWGISYDTPKRYNKYAWFAGISYSLIQGLRWLRGADYPHYYNDIVTLWGNIISISYQLWLQMSLNYCIEYGALCFIIQICHFGLRSSCTVLC